MIRPSGAVLIGTKPKHVGQRTLTDVEVQAQEDAYELTDAQFEDLQRGGWKFTAYARLDDISESAPVEGEQSMTVVPDDAPLIISPEPGPILAAVKADLKALVASGKTANPAHRSLENIALWLARVMDGRGDDGGASTAARLAQELRATMVALTTERSAAEVDAATRLAELLSTPETS